LLSCVRDRYSVLDASPGSCVRCGVLRRLTRSPQRDRPGRRARVIRVMFADDEEIVRSSLCTMSTGADGIEVVGEASDGRSAVEVARRHHPDVVLLDIKMAGEEDGLEALRGILALPEPPTVAMLTTFDIDSYVSRALSAGAQGFLLKDIRPASLVQAVRDLARGGAVLDPGVAARMVRAQRDEARAAEPARELLAS